MKTTYPIALLASCTLFLVGCNAASDIRTDSNRKIKIGMTSEEVVEKLGQPRAKQTFVRSAEPVWGVIETWWSDLRHGDKVEIWNYTNSKGTVSVYFLNGSDKVWHTSFVKKGVVF